MNKVNDVNKVNEESTVNKDDCVVCNVELPGLEVTRRVENRSPKVARKSKGLWRPNPAPSPSLRDSSSRFAPADFPLTRANQLGACNEATNIFSRIY